MVLPAPLSTPQPLGRLSSVSAVAVIAVIRAQPLLAATLEKRSPAAVAPILTHIPGARPSVVKSRDVEPRPGAVGVMSPEAPWNPTTLRRAVPGGAVSAVSVSA